MSNICLQRLALGTGLSCTVRHFPHTAQKLSLRRTIYRLYSSISWRNEQMQQTQEQRWNNNGKKLTGKINNGQSTPSAFLQSPQITEQWLEWLWKHLRKNNYCCCGFWAFGREWIPIVSTSFSITHRLLQSKAILFKSIYIFEPNFWRPNQQLCL